MIVNYTIKGWEIITQRAHELLAAQIAWQWEFTYPAHHHVETLLAIAGHDDTAVEFEKTHLLTPADGPFQYAMRGFDPEHCHQLMTASRAKSRYFASMHAMHLIFLYGREKNAAARKCMAQIRRYIKSTRRALNLTAEEACRAYALMQWCDALSVIICKHAIQPEYRMTEINKGPDRVPYQLCQLSPTVLSIAPWPFMASRFTVMVESRIVPQLHFESCSELLAALEQSTVKECIYTIVKKRSQRKTGK